MTVVQSQSINVTVDIQAKAHDAAKEAWTGIGFVSDRFGQAKDLEFFFAKAIFAERERCAEMAEDLQLMGKDGYEISSAIRGTS